MLKGMKGPLPPWVKDLWKELTTPPGFLKTPPGSKGTSKGDNHSSDRKGNSFSATARGHPTSAGTNQQDTPEIPVTLEPTSRTKPRSKSKKVTKKKSPVHRRVDGRTSQLRTKINHVLHGNGYAPEMLDLYGWSALSAHPHGSVIQIRTPERFYALKRTHLSGKRIEFMSEALYYLREKGFRRFSSIVPIQDGNVYAQNASNTYYATQWVTGREVDLSDLNQINECASTVVRFHELSRGFEANGFHPADAFDLVPKATLRVRQLESFIARANNQSRPDPIDEIVIEHGSTFLQQAKEAVSMMSDPVCAAHLEEEQDDPGLCHLDLIESNMIYTGKGKGKVHLIDFDMMSYGPRVLDITHLLRRCMQKTNWSTEAALIILVQVNGVRPFTYAEYLLLQGLLTFPHRFWRICRDHYEYKAWGDTMRWLEEITEQEKRRQLFLTTFEEQLTRRHRA